MIHSRCEGSLVAWKVRRRMLYEMPFPADKARGSAHDFSDENIEIGIQSYRRETNFREETHDSLV
jgi:hypothetical protein